MKEFDITTIRSWNPCYDPNKFLPEDWKGNVLDILLMKDIPVHDRLWAALRTELVSEKLMRLFAVWSYRQTLIFLPNQDSRSIEAANVAERFANGKATREELVVAKRDSYAVYAGAAGAAEYAAAAAYTAAAEYTEYAAGAAEYAAGAAEYAAGAFGAARDSQVNKLIEMIKVENNL